MKTGAALTVLALLVASCGKKLEGWSEVVSWKDGNGKTIGTLGLALSRGPSGKIEFVLGPWGSIFGLPATPEVEKDSALIGTKVGKWALEKDNTKVVLSRDSRGQVKTDGYENTDTEVWNVLSSPGCSTLSASIEPVGNSGVVVQKTYRFCDVDVAVGMLRK